MLAETIHQETIYRGKAFNVRRDEVRFPGLPSFQLDIVEHAGAVAIVPVDADGRILFVSQYRHAIGKELLEVPAGTLDENEQPEACALREIREETGFATRNLIKLGEFHLAPGYSTEYMYVYLATELHAAPLQGDEDEFITLVPIPVEKAFEMALSGELVDGKTLAALLLARPLLQHI